MKKTITIIASALPEELNSFEKYISTHYCLDEVFNEVLDIHGIIPYDEHALDMAFRIKSTNNGFVYYEHPAPHKIDEHREDAGLHKIKKIQTKIKASAYKTSEKSSMLLLQTGVGQANAHVTIGALLQVLEKAFGEDIVGIDPKVYIEKIIFVGSCLGISNVLRKGDLVLVSKLKNYDEPISNIPDFNMYELAGTEEKDFGKKGDGPNEAAFFEEYGTRVYTDGILLSGEVFVDVKKRKSLGHRGYEILPEKAQRCVVQLHSAAHKDQHPQMIGLDMESAGFVRAIYEYEQATNASDSRSINLKSTKVLMSRVVLDTIHDEKRINYREDIMTVADILSRYIRASELKNTSMQAMSKKI